MGSDMFLCVFCLLGKKEEEKLNKNIVSLLSCKRKGLCEEQYNINKLHTAMCTTLNSAGEKPFHLNTSTLNV